MVEASILASPNLISAATIMLVATLSLPTDAPRDLPLRIARKVRDHVGVERIEHGLKLQSDVVERPQPHVHIRESALNRLERRKHLKQPTSRECGLDDQSIAFFVNDNLRAGHLEVARDANRLTASVAEQARAMFVG